MKAENIKEPQKPAFLQGAVSGSFACKKIKAGKYEYRGWIISCVGYYEPDKKVAWEGYDPKTGCADFLGFSKREIKMFIDIDLSKNAR